MRVMIAISLTACVSSAPDEPPPPPTAEPLVHSAQQAPRGPCDYTESHDASNDYLAESGYALEATGLVFSGQAMTICGQIDNGHYNAAESSIDIDNYGFDLAADADVIVTLTGDAQYIATVGAWAYDPASGTIPGGGYFNYDHGVFSAHLAAGHYELSIEAYDSGDVAAAVPYHLTIAGDSPATRCAALATPSSYIEAGDGSDSHGNDVFDVDFDTAPYRMFTQTPMDRPEDFEVPLDSGAPQRIDGEAAMIAPVGSYLDHDTYLVMTGPTTNQLTIRLDWTSENVDLDYYLSTAGATYPIGSSATARLGGGEFATIAVAPGTRYWLWVGSYQSSLESSHYDATLCGETFAN
jgi:hypothetical protein